MTGILQKIPVIFIYWKRLLFHTADGYSACDETLSGIREHGRIGRSGGRSLVIHDLENIGLVRRRRGACGFGIGSYLFEHAAHIAPAGAGIERFVQRDAEGACERRYVGFGEPSPCLGAVDGDFIPCRTRIVD